jgi:hypothetical protein
MFVELPGWFPKQHRDQSRQTDQLLPLPSTPGNPPHRQRQPQRLVIPALEQDRKAAVINKGIKFALQLQPVNHGLKNLQRIVVVSQSYTTGGSDCPALRFVGKAQ